MVAVWFANEIYELLLHLRVVAFLPLSHFRADGVSGCFLFFQLTNRMKVIIYNHVGSLFNAHFSLTCARESMALDE